MAIPMCTSQDFVNWVCNDDLNPNYLRFALVAETDSIRRWATGSTHKTLYFPEAKAIHLLMPDRKTQDAVAEVLAAFDDKIAANRRIVASADTLRTALWEEWTDNASLIPLSSIARFVNGKAFTRDATGTGKVVIRIAELNSGIGGSTVYNDIDVAEEHLARPGDLLMAWSGSLTTARWFRDEAIVNQHIFKVIPFDKKLMWATASALDTKMVEFKSIAAGKATTMGHIQRHNLDEPVSWPELTDAQQDLGDSLWMRALQAERENERLFATRYELLPLFMSGRISVSDFGTRVEQEV